MVNLRYSQLPLAGKILVPTLSIFLGIWATGNITIGYLAVRQQAYELRRETQNAATHASDELQGTHEFLSFKAKTLAQTSGLTEAISSTDQSSVLKMMLPLRSSLELDLVKVLTEDGTVLADLRSSRLGQIPLQEAEILKIAHSGSVFTSLIVTEDLSYAPR